MDDEPPHGRAAWHLVAGRSCETERLADVGAMRSASARAGRCGLVTPYERKPVERPVRVRRLHRALLFSAVSQVALVLVAIWIIVAEGQTVVGALIIGLLALSAPSSVKIFKRSPSSD